MDDAGRPRGPSEPPALQPAAQEPTWEWKVWSLKVLAANKVLERIPDVGSLRGVVPDDVLDYLDQLDLVGRFLPASSIDMMPDASNPVYSVWQDAQARFRSTGLAHIRTSPQLVDHRLLLKVSLFGHVLTYDIVEKKHGPACIIGWARELTNIHGRVSAQGDLLVLAFDRHRRCNGVVWNVSQDYCVARIVAFGTIPIARLISDCSVAIVRDCSIATASWDPQESYSPPVAGGSEFRTVFPVSVALEEAMISSMVVLDCPRRIMYATRAGMLRVWNTRMNACCRSAAVLTGIDQPSGDWVDLHVVGDAKHVVVELICLRVIEVWNHLVMKPLRRVQLCDPNTFASSHQSIAVFPGGRYAVLVLRLPPPASRLCYRVLDLIKGIFLTEMQCLTHSNGLVGPNVEELVVACSGRSGRRALLCNRGSEAFGFTAKIFQCSALAPCHTK